MANNPQSMTPRTLKNRRASLGLTQEQLAEQLGVVRNTINRWEMGLHPIPRWAEKVLSSTQERAGKPTAPSKGARGRIGDQPRSGDGKKIK